VLGLWFREAIGGGLIMRVSSTLAEAGWLPFAALPPVSQLQPAKPSPSLSSCAAGYNREHEESPPTSARRIRGHTKLDQGILQNRSRKLA
jgi:hypothetical protein